MPHRRDSVIRSGTLRRICMELRLGQILREYAQDDNAARVNASSRVRAAALLVLLPAAARARIVAADLLGLADDRLGHGPTAFTLGLRRLLLRFVARADRADVLRHAVPARVF